MSGEKGEGEKKPLTHDLDDEIHVVLSSRVVHRDGVEAFVFLLRPLDDEAAQGLPRLHADPPLGLGHHLQRHHEVGETDRRKQRTVSHDGGTGDSTFPLCFMFHSSFVPLGD